MELLLTLNLEDVTEEESRDFDNRTSARAVILDTEGNVALMHVSRKDYVHNLEPTNTSVDICHGDANERFEFQNEKFDAIVAGEIIEHLIDTHFFVSETSRILKQDGLFLGSTPNAARLDKRFLLLLGRDPKDFSDPTHLQYFTYDSLNRVLRSSFADTKIYCYRGGNIIGLGHSLFADGFIFVCKK